MEVILQQNIDGLGKKYDTVQVKSGYGNYLIAQKLAIVANATNKKVALENNRQAKHKQAKFEEIAQAAAYQLQESMITLLVKASKTGKVFGAVTPLQLANAMKKNGIQVDHNEVALLKPIKEVGTYEAKVNLGYNVETTFKFEVKAEEES